MVTIQLPQLFPKVLSARTRLSREKPKVKLVDRRRYLAGVGGARLAACSVPASSTMTVTSHRRRRPVPLSLVAADARHLRQTSPQHNNNRPQYCSLHSLRVRRHSTAIARQSVSERPLHVTVRSMLQDRCPVCPVCL